MSGPVDWYKSADKKLQGTPNEVMTPLLLAAGVILIVVALFGRPAMKGAALAWIVLP